MTRMTPKHLVSILLLAGLTLAVWWWSARNRNPSTETSPATADHQPSADEPIIVNRALYAMGTRFDCTVAVTDEGRSRSPL
jgi:hypothetical protein